MATIFLEFVSCRFGNYGKNLEKITKLLKLQNWGGETGKKNLGVGEHCILCIFVNLDSISPYLEPDFHPNYSLLESFKCFPLELILVHQIVNNLFFLSFPFGVLSQFSNELTQFFPSSLA